MNQLAAFRDTLALAEDRGMPEHGGELGLAHLRSMYKRAETSNFSPSKLGRWLGWAQCAVVAAAIGLTETIFGASPRLQSGDSRSRLLGSA